MNSDRAIKMAIKALELQKRGLAFDANVYKMFGGKKGINIQDLYPRGGKAFMEYQKIEEAIKILSGLVDNGND
jgi:hypothetical protein